MASKGKTSTRAWLLPSLRGYQRGWLRARLAGLSAGAVVIPQAMAYATIAGLPVEIGLYTCMLPMLVYALLGGSRSLSVSTTSTIAILVASSLAGLSGGRSDEALLRAAFTLTVLVGVCLLVMRLFRLGSLVEQISPATLTGVKFGVGQTVAVTQLPALLGITADPDDEGFFGKLADVIGKLGGVNLTTTPVSRAMRFPPSTPMIYERSRPRGCSPHPVGVRVATTSGSSPTLAAVKDRFHRRVGRLRPGRAR